MEEITNEQLPDKVTGNKLTAAEVNVLKNKANELIAASNNLETKTTGIFKTTNGAEVSIDMSTYSPGYVLAAHPSQSNTLIFIEAGTEPANQTPTVNAGEDLEITLPTDTVQLLGTASDPDGTIESYLWSQVSGPAANIATPSTQNTIVSGLTEGAYVFRLTVTDDDGAMDTDDVTVTVNADPTPQITAESNVLGEITVTLL